MSVFYLKPSLELSCLKMSSLLLDKDVYHHYVTSGEAKVC